MNSEFLSNSMQMNGILKNLDEKSEFYLNNKDRFNKMEDIQKLYKNERLFKKRISLNFRKNIFMERNNRNAEKFIENEKKQKQKIKNQMKKRKNNILMSINPISLKFLKTKKAEKIQENEKFLIVKKLIRLKNLDYQQHPRFNIINGSTKENNRIPLDILDKIKNQIVIPKRKVRLYKQTFHI